jgi:heme/copper-type cytochrome/quinol oxidase subunit 2
MRLSFADGLFWSSVACCAFAQILILRSVSGGIRRHASERAPNLPRQRGAVELVWAVVPALALAALLVFTWRAMHPSPGQSRAAEFITETAR